MAAGFTKVSIKNFKSIRDLEFAPKRVNVFIGEANTGKSNIVEALAVFSEGVYDDNETCHDVLRFKTAADLFYDFEVTEIARVTANGVDWSLKFQPPHFAGTYLGPPGRDGVNFSIEQAGSLRCNALPWPQTRFYRYKSLSTFTGTQLEALRAPYGTNLLTLLTTNKRLRGLVSDLFKERGYRLVINGEASELGMAKEVHDELYVFKYPSVSETFRRFIFFMAILETNRDAILLFDEPESNTYPFYTAYLAERIALDESNQFFLTTHNANIVGSIVGKTPSKDLAVFVTTMEGYQTRLRLVPEQKLPLILDYGQDAFMNLDKLVE